MLKKSSLIFRFRLSRDESVRVKGRPDPAGKARAERGADAGILHSNEDFSIEISIENHDGSTETDDLCVIFCSVARISCW